MKKTLKITTLFFIITVIALNSLVAFILFYNHNYVRSHQQELFSQNNYFDVETSLLKTDSKFVKWIDDSELEMNGAYFDVLKIEKLSESKSRVYFYSDDLETGLIKKIKDQELDKTSGKKSERSVFSDLLQLKSYTKNYSFNMLLSSQDLIFKSLQVNTQEGHCDLPYHPPLA